jgi:hypothetical protein
LTTPICREVKYGKSARNIGIDRAEPRETALHRAYSF